MDLGVFKGYINRAVSDMKNISIEYKKQFYIDKNTNKKKVKFLATINLKDTVVCRISGDAFNNEIRMDSFYVKPGIDKDIEYSIRQYIDRKMKEIPGEQLSLFDEGFKVGVYLNEVKLEKLDEANMNQIRSKQMNSNREQDKRRNARASQIASEYMGISKFGIFNFRTQSQTHPGYYWYQTIECPNIIGLADIIEDPEEHIEVKDIDVLLKANDVMIFCDDPDFLYSGFKYMAYSKRYGNKPENRPPVIRNPKEEGAVCKHLYSVIQLIDQMPIREQMAKDTEQWLHYMNGDKYTQFAKPVKAGQVKRKDKRLDWEDYAGELQKYFTNIADNRELIDKNDIDGSIKAYVDIVNKEKPTMTLDQLIYDLTGNKDLNGLIADMNITDDTEDLRNYLIKYFKDIGF